MSRQVTLKPTPYRFEYRTVAEALYAALTEDAFYIAMENSVCGPKKMRREAMLRYYDYSLQEGRKYGALHVSRGHAVGASIWAKPVRIRVSKIMAELKKGFLQKQMGAASLDAYTQITASMAQQTATVIPPDCWYLSIIGIAPAFQGQGIGETLIRPVLEQTDANGCATYLETFTPRNMRFYAKLGYREAGSFDEPGTGARYWVMVREP